MRKPQMTKTPLGDGRHRYKVQLMSEPVEKGTTQERLEKASVLRAIADQPDLSVVNGEDFETMRAFYSGSCWVFEFEVVGQ